MGRHKESQMTKQTEIDVREVVRVIFSGVSAYFIVHFFLLPWLMARSVEFPTYLYLGIAVTIVLSTAICSILRPRADASQTTEHLHPAE